MSLGSARASVNILTQLGAETTPGTAVPCDKKLPGLTINLSPSNTTKFYRPSGKKYLNTGVLQKVSARGNYKGPLSFTEIIYPLSGYIGSADPTAIPSTSAKQWDFLPSDTGPESNKSFTWQEGDASAAQQAAYVVFNSVKINLTRDSGEISGTCFSQPIDESATLTASPTDVSQMPVSGNTIDFYIDSTFGGIGGTKMTDPYELDIDLPEKFVEKWPVNSSNASWKEPVEKATEPSGYIILENNAQTRTLIAAMKQNQLPTYYLRFKCTGIAIGTSAYLLQGDFAIKYEDHEKLQDQGGVYGYKLKFKIVDDSTMGRPYSFRVINTQASL